MYRGAAYCSSCSIRRLARSASWCCPNSSWTSALICRFSWAIWSCSARRSSAVASSARSLLSTTCALHAATISTMTPRTLLSSWSSHASDSSWSMYRARICPCAWTCSRESNSPIELHVDDQDDDRDRRHRDSPWAAAPASGDAGVVIVTASSVVSLLNSPPAAVAASSVVTCLLACRPRAAAAAAARSPPSAAPFVVIVVVVPRMTTFRASGRDGRSAEGCGLGRVSPAHDVTVPPATEIAGRPPGPPPEIAVVAAVVVVAALRCRPFATGPGGSHTRHRPSDSEA